MGVGDGKIAGTIVEEMGIRCMHTDVVPEIMRGWQFNYYSSQVVLNVPPKVSAIINSKLCQIVWLTTSFSIVCGNTCGKRVSFSGKSKFIQRLGEIHYHTHRSRFTSNPSIQRSSHVKPQRIGVTVEPLSTLLAPSFHYCRHKDSFSQINPRIDRGRRWESPVGLRPQLLKSKS